MELVWRKGGAVGEAGVAQLVVHQVVVGHQQQRGSLGLLAAVSGDCAGDEPLQGIGPAVPVSGVLAAVVGPPVIISRFVQRPANPRRRGRVEQGEKLPHPIVSQREARRAGLALALKPLGPVIAGQLVLVVTHRLAQLLRRLRLGRRQHLGLIQRPALRRSAQDTGVLGGDPALS